MKLKRFLANIVRAGESTEIVTLRNFDDLGSILDAMAKAIEGHDDALTDNGKRLARLFGAIILSAPQGVLQLFSISSPITIQSGQYLQHVSPIVETGITVTIEAGGLWFVDA